MKVQLLAQQVIVTVSIEERQLAYGIHVARSIVPSLKSV